MLTWHSDLERIREDDQAAPCAVCGAPTRTVYLLRTARGETTLHLHGTIGQDCTDAARSLPLPMQA